MKKVVVFLFILFVGLTACQKNTENAYRLQGYFEGKAVKDSSIITLVYPVFKDSLWYNKKDSSLVINNQFKFQGYIEDLTTATIYFDDSDEFFYPVELFIEASDMEIKIDVEETYRTTFKGSSIDGINSELNSLVFKYHRLISNSFKSTIKNINLLNNTENLPVRDSLIQNINTLKTERNAYSYGLDSVHFNFVSLNIDTDIATSLLYKLATKEDTDIAKIKQLYNSLPAKSKDRLMGKLLEKQIEFIENNRQGAIGLEAPNFEKYSSSGELITLTDYKNKNFVLLDFWASWCKPCLKSIPQLKDIYTKYKDEGLIVIGVSLDDNNDNWLEAINKYELNIWSQILCKEINVNDDILFKSDLSDMFDIGDSIPCYILIDKEGIILAKWNHLGEKELKELETYIYKNN